MDPTLDTLLYTPVYQRLAPIHLLSALALLALAWLGSRFASSLLWRFATRLKGHRWQHALLDAVAGPSRGVLMIAGCWAALMVLMEQLLSDWSSASSVRWLIAVQIPFVLWGLLRLIDNVTEIWLQHAQGTQSAFDDQLVPIVRTSTRVVVLIMGLLSMLQVLNYPVGSLLAGLGIGGMAIALAAKDTLANLFGSLVILIDRPFTVGDWVEIGKFEGTVEEVGLRVTRIRTFANSLISIPNGGLTTQAVNNWSKMQKRRLSLDLGVTYDASPEQLEAAVVRLREILQEHPKVRNDFFLVNFKSFGPSSLDLFIYCFIDTTDWAEYLQNRQDLLLIFMRELRALGLSLAFPTQTLHLRNDAAAIVDPSQPKA